MEFLLKAFWKKIPSISLDDVEDNSHKMVIFINLRDGEVVKRILT